MNSTLTFKEAQKFAHQHGFMRVRHSVVVHHLLKDFAEYHLRKHAFYIKPVGVDFIHMAVIEYEREVMANWENTCSSIVQVSYTCAADDLLYGLRVKFNSGSSFKPENDLHEILTLITGHDKPGANKYAFESIRNHPRYIKERFRFGRQKAKIRAFLVMLKDKWFEFNNR